MGWFNRSSSSNSYTTNNYNTSYGNATGGGIGNIFGDKVISTGYLNNEASDGGFSVGGIATDTVNRSDNTSSTMQKNSDEFGLSVGASVGVGGNAGSASGGGVGVGGASDSLGVNALGGGTSASGINPLILGGLGFGVILLFALKKGK